MKKLSLTALMLCSIFAATIAFASDKANLNLVDADQIVKSASVSQKIAEEIVNYRQDMGDFTEYDELKDIAGISAKDIENIKKAFSIEGITDIDCGC